MRTLFIFIVSVVLAACNSPVNTETNQAEQETPPAESPNNPPEIVLEIAGKMHAESELNIAAVAEDPDGDDLEITIGIDEAVHASSSVIWIPPGEGEYTIVAEAFDGKDTAADERTVSIGPKPWQPKPMTLYILDGDGGIYLESYTTDPALFESKRRSWSTTVELYNRDRNKPGPYPYRLVTGEPPEGA